MRKESPILYYKSLDQTIWPLSHLIFDLDNTIYPSSSLLAAEMHTRMTEFVARYLHIELQNAEAIRQDGYSRHGTTLRWLQEEQGLRDPEAFLDFVHPTNISDFLPPSTSLKPFLESLALPMAILTNAPRSHAERVLAYYGIADCFDHIFDLKANGYVGKPHQIAYENCLTSMGCPANLALFVDDIPEYLQTFHTMGGHCILVDEKRHHGETRWPSITTIFELSHYIS